MKKVFFSASIYAIPELLENYLMIVKNIEASGSLVVSDWTKSWLVIAKKYKKMGKPRIKERDILKVIDREKLYEEHTKAIQECDVVIAEVTKPTITVGYQLFYAISHKKPVLALYSSEAKNIDLNTIKSIIYSGPPLILLKKYSSKSLPFTINNFLKKKREVLKKFNFIINEEIEKYLKWLNKKRPDKSMSDLLREKLMDEIIINDADFQNSQKASRH
ncbi:nucleoside 2-deoxyribosyltransferase [Patescibacteria group bacterium]|nr:nucleoside 2-deoxyribosyltransferase [Patescibacteria group bacterium]MBU2219871.1 nucleoside 2-deoxyribosyltransferase [Patescibacteria group bacterium]MBU2265215.1 nucleoside 2-deoxyribosyltransferase [Patescibacteria group bacterium]